MAISLVAHRKRRLAGSPAHGFSLVELLVAMSILLLLVTMIGTMLGGVMSYWQQDEARGERRDVAQRALALMARDLSAASLPLNNPDTSTLQFLIDPTAAVQVTNETSHSVFWQAPVTTDQAGTSTYKGNIAIVGYFVRTVGNQSCLCRLLVNPSDTSNFLIYNSPNGWLNSTIINTLAPASGPVYQGLVGQNVLGLWVQALDPNGHVITKTAAAGAFNNAAYDSRQGYSYTGTDSSGNSLTITRPGSSLPAAVQLGLVVIDSRAAAQISSGTILLNPSTTDAAVPTNLTPTVLLDMQKFVAALPVPLRHDAEVFSETVPLPQVLQ